MTAVLVSGIGKRNHLLRLMAEACAAHDAGLIGADASDLAPGRAEIETFELLPMAGDPTFAKRYVEVVREHGVAAFLTIVDPEIPVLGTLAEADAFGAARYLNPAAATALVCEDKLRFHEVMREHGVPSVPTYLAPPTGTPYIRKDRRGSAASGFLLVESASDLREASAEPVFQPYVTGQHYCVDAYFSLATGELVDCCVKEVLAKQSGETYLLRSVPRDDFTGLVRDVARALPLRGIVNLDVYDVDGELAVMEVNCRIGGNYPAAHALGVDLLRWALLEGVAGETVRESFSDYPSRMLVSKYFGFSEP